MGSGKNTTPQKDGQAISSSTNYTNRADRGEEEKFKQSDCITSVGLKITPHGADLRGSPLVTCVLQLNLE